MPGSRQEAQCGARFLAYREDGDGSAVTRVTLFDCTKCIAKGTATAAEPDGTPFPLSSPAT